MGDYLEGCGLAPYLLFDRRRRYASHSAILVATTCCTEKKQHFPWWFLHFWSIARNVIQYLLQYSHTSEVRSLPADYSIRTTPQTMMTTTKKTVSDSRKIDSRPNSSLTATRSSDPENSGFLEQWIAPTTKTKTNEDMIKVNTIYEQMSSTSSRQCGSSESDRLLSH